MTHHPNEVWRAQGLDLTVQMSGAAPRAPAYVRGLSANAPDSVEEVQHGRVFTRAGTCAVVLAAAFTGTVGPAQGAESVHITAHEVFGGASTFTSTIPGCTPGTVTTVGDHTSFVRPFGTFNGFQVFECSGGVGTPALPDRITDVYDGTLRR